MMPQWKILFHFLKLLNTLYKLPSGNKYKVHMKFY